MDQTFIVGMVEKGTEARRILVGTTGPVVEDLHDISDGGKSSETYDWGMDASEEAAFRLAYLILSTLGNVSAASLYFSAYANSVVRSKMVTGMLWVLIRDDVERWITEHTGSI